MGVKDTHSIYTYPHSEPTLKEQLRLSRQIEDIVLDTKRSMIHIGKKEA